MARVADCVRAVRDHIAAMTYEELAANLAKMYPDLTARATAQIEAVRVKSRAIEVAAEEKAAIERADPRRMELDALRAARDRLAAHTKHLGTSPTPKIGSATERTHKQRTDLAEAARRARERLVVPERRMCHLLRGARIRAQQRGFAFDAALFEIFSHDPPSRCACCDVLLDYTTGRGQGATHGSASPSFDRKRNDEGYTVANTQVLCVRCNGLKSDGTLTEFEAIVAYMRPAT